MSERKEEIVKDSLIDESPSGLSDSSTTVCKELEDERNLSKLSKITLNQDKPVQNNKKNPKNKIYSAIGINKRLFKQKPLENKKTSVPNPTKRDLLLLETLESYGVLSTQQIRELIFKGINTRTVLRRLRLLKQRGFIYSIEGLPNGALALG